MNDSIRRCSLCAIICLVVAPARAQLAVIDVPAIVQLVQQVEALQQQVKTAQSQLAQAQLTLGAMTGDRGMQWLLSGTVRNYLPSNWTQLLGVLGGAPGGYSTLAANVRTAVAANSILTPTQIAALPDGAQQQVSSARQLSALQQAVSEAALMNSSSRFMAIQSLVNAIGSATDQKATLDLEARITAELGMLQNEQTKLQILDQAMRSLQAVQIQQERERIIAGQGNFAGRFQPVP